MMNQKVVNVLNNKTRLGSLTLLLFSCTYLGLSFDLQIDQTFNDQGFTSRTLPVALAIAGILCALIQLAANTSASAEQDHNQRLSSEFVSGNWFQVSLLVCLMLIYSWFFDWLGFLLGGTLFLLAGFFALGERRFGLAVAVATGLAGGLWFLLSQVFGLYLDSGELYRILLGSNR